MLKTEPDFQVLLGTHGPYVPPDKEQDCPVFWLAQSSNPTSKDRRAGDYFVTTLHKADNLLGLKSTEGNNNGFSPSSAKKKN